MTEIADERDQAGHYAILQITADATADEVTAAYRRAAKRLHPDMPETGDRAAFLRLQEAYQLLGDPILRAGYDQAARASTRPTWRQEERALGFVAPLSWRLPPFFGLAMAVLTVLALAQVGWLLSRPAPTPASHVPTPPPRQDALAQMVGLPTQPADRGGDHYIAPAPAPAVLWARSPSGQGLHRTGQLPTFSSVTLTHPADAEGYAEIKLPAGQIALIEATRLLPGDARAARTASCLYYAGAPPRGGALLVRPAGGAVRVAVENREDRPAVFKLRDAAGKVSAALYLAPRGQATVDDLPAGSYAVEFAVGDLWSAPCGRFMAGMRAQRLPLAQELRGPARFSISAALSAEDIGDDAFSRE